MATFLLIKYIFRVNLFKHIFVHFKHLFLVLIAMLLSMDATPQVTADFTTLTSTTGCGSLVVEFKDLSLGNPSAWLWDFGNGNTSILENPIAVYNSPGSYDVVLKVTDGIDNDNDGKIDSEDDNEIGEPRSFAANVAINKIAEDILNDIMTTW